MQTNGFTKIEVFNKTQRKIFYILAGLSLAFAVMYFFTEWDYDLGEAAIFSLFLVLTGCILFFLAKTQITVLYILEGALFINAIIWFIYMIDGIEAASYPAAIVVAIDCATIFFTIMISKRNKRYRQYNDLIMNQGVESVDTIAAACDISETVVIEDIKKLAVKGVIPKEIVNRMLPKGQAAPLPQTSFSNNFRTSAPPQMVTVACPGCGAQMTIARGSFCSCEYCGTSVHA